jgi:GNAT superfamily N-acetyltransferase
MDQITIKPAREADVPVILQMIKGLAEYERLSHQVIATEDSLRETLFGPRPAAEVVLAYDGREPVGFALFFHNYSTFMGRPGLYLEDLFVVPSWRGRGVGRLLLTRLASIAVERGCGRMEWAVLDWNESAIGFYKRLGASLLEDWRVCRLTGEALVRAATAAV